MQNWQGCDQLETEKSIQLKDSRDGIVYTVAKLKDGRCWMVDNLRIQNKTLTSEDSDLSSSFILPASSEPNTWSNNDYMKNEVYIDKEAAYGGYYTWYTAVAGNITSSTSSGDIQTSICPKGWKLPTGSPGGEFEKLAKAYGNGTDQATSAALRATPIPNFGIFGAVWNSSMYSRDILTRWWSSTARAINDAYNLRIDATTVKPSDAGMTSGGNHVRCVQSSGSCFAADTLIDTPNGPQPIQNIQNGSTIYAYDFESHTIKETIVTEAYQHTKDDVMRLTIDDGSVVKGTSTHPFYDFVDQDWDLLRDMSSGNKLMTIDGEELGVISLSEESESVVYNLKVKDYNNFIIVTPTGKRLLVLGVINQQIYNNLKQNNPQLFSWDPEAGGGESSGTSGWTYF